MSQEQRIRNLEEAVLHLSRAINRLIEARKMESFSRDGDRESPRGRLGDLDPLVGEAYEAVEKAVNLLSVEEYERG